VPVRGAAAGVEGVTVQVIDAASVRNAAGFFGRSHYWLLMDWRHRLGATLAFAELFNRGRYPFPGMFGCAFSRPQL
jgi:hypothetical protein